MRGCSTQQAVRAKSDVAEKKKNKKENPSENRLSLIPAARLSVAAPTTELYLERPTDAALAGVLIRPSPLTPPPLTPISRGLGVDWGLGGPSHR